MTAPRSVLNHIQVLDGVAGQRWASQIMTRWLCRYYIFNIPMILFEKGGPFEHSGVGWYLVGTSHLPTSRFMCWSVHWPQNSSNILCNSWGSSRFFPPDQLITFAGQSLHDQKLKAEQTRGTFHVLQLSFPYLSQLVRHLSVSRVSLSLIFSMYLYQNASRKA